MSKLTNIEVEGFLRGFERESKVEFLEDGSKEKKDLIDSAKKRGILVEGSRDLGILKTIFLYTDIPNANKAIVPSKEFQKKFSTIVGKPMNIGHMRTMTVGFYIDYRYIMKENKAITYAIFFKSNYPDLWKKAQQFQKKGKLSSSFEIWSNNKDMEYNEDGSYVLNNLELAGGALIFEENGELPAFKDAKVLALAKKTNLGEYIDEQYLVYASKYKCTELLTAKGKLKCSNCGKCKTAEVEILDKPEVIVHKIKCANCQEELDLKMVPEISQGLIKCPKCFAILNGQNGAMIHPPQIKDFKIACPICHIDNWLILSKKEETAKLKCLQCAKEYNITFKKESNNENISKLQFVYANSISCYQCGKQISYSGSSGVATRKTTCPECKLEFMFDISKVDRYKKIAKIEEVENVEKSIKKGGNEKMELKVEKEKADKIEATLPEDLGESAEVEKVEDKEKELESEEKPKADETPKVEEQPKAEESKEVKKEVVEKPTEEKLDTVEKTEKVEKVESKKLKEEIVKAGFKTVSLKVLSLREEIKKIKEETEKQIEFYKENAKKVIERRMDLEEEFSKDLSDEDLLNEDKFARAKAEKENIKLKVKLETSDKDTEIVGSKTRDNLYYAKKRKEIDVVAFGEEKK